MVIGDFIVEKKLSRYLLYYPMSHLFTRAEMISTLDRIILEANPSEETILELQVSCRRNMGVD